MARNYIDFFGGLVRKGELYKTDTGNSYVFITVANNYSEYDKETKTWKELGTIYKDCTLWGKDAESFMMSDIPLGTRLMISGELRYAPERTYTNKDGVEVTVPATESVSVDKIGVMLGYGQYVSEIGKTNGQNQPKQTQQKKAVKQEKPQDKKEPTEEKINQDVFESLFG